MWSVYERTVMERIAPTTTFKKHIGDGIQCVQNERDLLYEKFVREDQPPVLIYTNPSAPKRPASTFYVQYSFKKKKLLCIATYLY
ncbi:hypothetical protein HZS_4191 [Henneguya salminicola]|nr:hypothetical protein HZS_4191 [Henneguya salminicola]